MADPRQLPNFIDPDEQTQPTKADQVQAYLDSLKAKAQPTLDTVGSAYDALDKPKQDLINAAAPQFDLTKNSVTPQGSPEVRQMAKNVMQVGLPSPVDAVALGAGKAISMAPELAKGFSEFNGLGNEIGAAGSSLKDLKVGNMAADTLGRTKPSELGLGKTALTPDMSDLLADEVRKTGLERKAQQEAAAALAPPKQLYYQKLFPNGRVK